MSRSSANFASFRWRNRLAAHWLHTAHSAIPFCLVEKRKHFSLLSEAHACAATRFGAHSPISARPSVYARWGIHVALDAVHGSRICAILLPLAGSSHGTAPASTWIGSCLTLPHTSVTQAQ